MPTLVTVAQVHVKELTVCWTKPKALIREGMIKDMDMASSLSISDHFHHQHSTTLVPSTTASSARRAWDAPQNAAKVLTNSTVSTYCPVPVEVYLHHALSFQGSLFLADLQDREFFTGPWRTRWPKAHWTGALCTRRPSLREQLGASERHRFWHNPLPREASCLSA